MTTVTANPFAALNLPRAFRLTPDALAAALREHARAWHPDRFVKAGARERREALERSTAANDARRRLERWPSRAAALLVLAGVAVPEGAAAAGPDFLEAQLELREGLQAATAAGDVAALARLRADVSARLGALEAEAAALFDEPAWPERHAGALGGLVVRARFLEAVLADASRASPLGT
ncbi:MAG: iron-sulfur cluster co-chaperone HscB C-terminal domain-containing protein [Anaeromyxobacter sp.]